MSEQYIKKIEYCPHCGVKYQVEDSDPEGGFKCRICNFRNYVKSYPSVAAIIPNTENLEEIILAQRAFDPGKGKFDVPGGFVNYDENPESAIKRELMEEFGTEIKIDKLLNVKTSSYIQNEIEYPNIGIFFLMKPIKVEQIHLNQENLKVETFKIADITSGSVEINSKEVIDVLKEYLENL